MVPLEWKKTWRIRTPQQGLQKYYYSILLTRFLCNIYCNTFNDAIDYFEMKYCSTFYNTIIYLQNFGTISDCRQTSKICCFPIIAISFSIPIRNNYEKKSRKSTQATIFEIKTNSEQLILNAIFLYQHNLRSGHARVGDQNARWMLRLPLKPFHMPIWRSQSIDPQKFLLTFFRHTNCESSLLSNISGSMSWLIFIHWLRVNLAFMTIPSRLRSPQARWTGRWHTFTWALYIYCITGSRLSKEARRDEIDHLRHRGWIARNC